MNSGVGSGGWDRERRWSVGSLPRTLNTARATTDQGHEDIWALGKGSNSFVNKEVRSKVSDCLAFSSMHIFQPNTTNPDT